MEGFEYFLILSCIVFVLGLVFFILLGYLILVFVCLFGIDNFNEFFEYDLELCMFDEYYVIYGLVVDLDKRSFEGIEVIIKIELDGFGIGFEGCVGVGI